MAFDWHSQGQRRRGIPRAAWRRTVDKELRRAAKARREAKINNCSKQCALERTVGSVGCPAFLGGIKELKSRYDEE